VAFDAQRFGLPVPESPDDGPDRRASAIGRPSPGTESCDGGAPRFRISGGSPPASSPIRGAGATRGLPDRPGRGGGTRARVSLKFRGDFAESVCPE
jgi:hypothetical protein